MVEPEPLIIPSRVNFHMVYRAESETNLDVISHTGKKVH